MLLGALVGSLLGNMLAGKGVLKSCEGVIGAGEKVIRAVRSLKIHRQTKKLQQLFIEYKQRIQ